MQLFGKLILLIAIVGCSGPARSITVEGQQEVDADRVVEDLRFLSSPSLQGRAAGSPGNLEARAYIQRELKEAGVRSFPGGWLQNFQLGQQNATAANVIGYVQGSSRSDQHIVVTAHYDHLGTRGGSIYPGADDNASGTAALLEIARHFAGNPPESSIIFAALDAEELGLRGAHTFVRSPPVPRESIVLNVNMDMVGRNEQNELFASGTSHYPFLIPLVEEVGERSDITIRMGHDRPIPSPSDDWTDQSDHGAFHQAGIPFLYFGVEDHSDYHQPTDTFEKIKTPFFVDAVETVLDFVMEADERLDYIHESSRP